MYEYLISLSEWLGSLKMYPVFDIVHAYLAAVDIRKAYNKSDPGLNFGESYIFTILNTFAGSIIASYLVGEERKQLLALIAPLTDYPLVCLVSIVWFAVNYSPFDVVYRVGEIFPFKIILNVLKEIYRANKIRYALYHMVYTHHSSWITTKLFVGLVRGNGAGVVKEIWRIIRKVHSSKNRIDNELSQTTLLCLLASFVYFFVFVGLFPTSYEMVHLGVVSLLIFGRLAVLFSPDEVNELEKNYDQDKTVKKMKKATKQKIEKKTN